MSSNTKTVLFFGKERLVKYFTTNEELRGWFSLNHNITQEIWVGFYKKNTGSTCVSYEDAVDQALCFGWIDGIRKRVDEKSYTNRFSPRRKKSNWSKPNIKRFEELCGLNLVQTPGHKAFAIHKESLEGVIQANKTTITDHPSTKE